MRNLAMKTIPLILLYFVLIDSPVIAGPGRSIRCINEGPSPRYEVSLQKAVMSRLIWATAVYEGKKVGHSACRVVNSKGVIESYLCDNTVDQRYQNDPDYKDTYLGNKKNYRFRFWRNKTNNETVLALFRGEFKLQFFKKCVQF